MRRSYPVTSWILFVVLAGAITFFALRWQPQPSDNPVAQAQWQAVMLAKTLAHSSVEGKKLKPSAGQAWVNRAQTAVAPPFVTFEAMLIAEQQVGMFAFMRKKKFVVHTNAKRKGKELGKTSALDKQLYDLTNELQNKAKAKPNVLLTQVDKTTQTMWVATAAHQGKTYLGAAIVRLKLPSMETAKAKAAPTTQRLFFFSWLIAIGVVGFSLFLLRGSLAHIVVVLGLFSVALYPYVTGVETIRQSRSKPWQQRRAFLEKAWAKTPSVTAKNFTLLLPASEEGKLPLGWKSSSAGAVNLKVQYATLAAEPIRFPTWPFVMLGGLALFVYALYGFGVFRRFGLLMRNYGHAYLYTTPAMLGMIVLVFVPFVVGIGLSFFRHTGGGNYTFVGFQNFIEILSVPWNKVLSPLSFYFTLGVTILWTSLNVLLHVSIGLGLALLLKSPMLRMKEIYRVILILPWAVPNYITALIWKGMFHKQFGAINALLGNFGVQEIAWFSSFTKAFSANLITNTWLGFPFMMVVALGALQSIPTDLYEAADVDGANRWQKFRYITLPLLKPALFPAIILGSIWTFNMFNIIYLVSGGAPDGATDILITEAYRWAFQRGDRFGYAAAYSVIIFLILLAYSLATQQLTQATEDIYQKK
ncbi:MAG: sugar ABC transporter permease [Deltaproteobacteria bacterium]|nr:MAG: sugar ABC transporter permease [Deltaproteobacteria bacterium]